MQARIIGSLTCFTGKRYPACTMKKTFVLDTNVLQIDNPYLDASSNGLTYATERLKEQPLHGHVTLRRSERSELAAVAAEYL